MLQVPFWLEHWQAVSLPVSVGSLPVPLGSPPTCATGVTLSASGATSAVSTAASVGFAPGGGLLALPAALVDSIHKGEFVDLKDLLPEYVFEAFISAGDKDKEKKKKIVSIETFQDLALAYTTSASTIIII